MASLVRQYVTFTLMGEEYALQIENVREIIECDRVTAIPSMPAVVRGVINLRGNVVPIVDLPVKFGHRETTIGAATYVVVLDLVWGGEAIRLGLITSELGRVIDVQDGDLRPVPDFGTRIQSEYLRGVGQIDGRFVLFLDGDRLLSPDELLRLTALEGAAPPSAEVSRRAEPSSKSGEI